MDFDDLIKNRKSSKKPAFRKVYKDIPTADRKKEGLPMEEGIESLSKERLDNYAKNIQKIAFDSFGVDLLKTKRSKNLDDSLCLIVSGGESREKEYFKLILENKYLFPKIKFEFVTGTDVIHRMIRTSKDYIKKIKNYQGYILSNDVFAILTDVDSFTKDIIEAIPICKKQKIDLIISNPCFEIWLYYHYFKEEPIDFCPSCEEKTSHEFKTYLHTKVKGGVKPEKDIFMMNKAIENSLNNYKESRDSFPKPYATQMHLLMKRIEPYIKDGLEKIKDMYYKNARDKSKKV
ncbi:MAG: RloB family protein [Bacteroidales bacterium]